MKYIRLNKEREAVAREFATGIQLNSGHTLIAELMFEIDCLRKDIETGFMPGAYARLQYLQSLENQFLEKK